MVAVLPGTAASRRPFVAREFELAELIGGLGEAREGRGRLFLLSGDAGIGKTRLVEAMADAAEGAGVGVLWGRCCEGVGNAPYLPWAEILGAELRVLDEGERRRHAPVLPHLARLAPDPLAPTAAPAPVRWDAPGARAALFDAATTFLRDRSAARGRVIVLEDLHAADRGTVQLLRHVVRELPNARLMVVATYREPELRTSPSLHRLVSAVGRHGRRITLAGIDEDGVAALLEAAGADATVRALARAIQHHTDGNPFFVAEVARSGGGAVPDAVPDDVRDLLRARFSRLPPDLHGVLVAASVLGCRFDETVLAAMTTQPPPSVGDLLASAAELGVVAPGGPGVWCFAHELVREALYSQLTPARRAALHRQAGEATERWHPSTRSGRASLLAHHFFEAARAGDGARAAHWCAAAGDEAREAMAFEDAALHYGRALEALVLSPPVDERRRYRLLVALAAVHACAGDVHGARDTYQRALKSARVLADPELVATAAIGIAAAVPPGVDDPGVSVLEEALASLPDQDSALRARVLVLLARAQARRPAAWSGPAASGAWGRDLGRQGVEMVRRCGDAEAVRAVLWDWHEACAGDPGTLEERLRVADELVDLAGVAGDREWLVLARVQRAADRFEGGDLEEVVSELGAAGAEADRSGNPLLAWAVLAPEAGLALVRGEVARAEQVARQAATLGERAGSPQAPGVLARQLMQVCEHQGRFAEYERRARALIDSEAIADRLDCAWVGLGRVAAYQGRNDDARGHLDAAVAALAKRAGASACCAASLAHLAWLLGAAESAAAIYTLLRPYRGCHLTDIAARCSLGACDRYLGQMAALAGWFDEAERRFEAAHQLHARLGAPLWRAHTLADHALVLLRRGGDGDRQRARELRAAAAAGFRALGLDVHAARAAAEDEAPAAADALPAQAGPDRARLCQEGEYWAFHYGGQVARLRDSKGLRYLARLLHAPGQELHALDLVAEGGSRGPGAGEPGLGGGAGDAGAVLDARAKAAYKARLDELREELEEATAHHDLGRAARAREEMDFLVAELSAAVGLGGRDRRAASDAERARQSVTRAVKGAIERLAEAHPSLGEHLRSTVRTGIYSAYVPDPRAPIVWER
jgi:hypothetical protein